MTKKIKSVLAPFGFFGAILAAKTALAADFGLNQVNNGLANSLAATDPRILVGRIIQIALSFLGVIAVALIIYAGFLWMASEGDEERLNQAKTILKNTVIGLVIILAAWGITTFILMALGGAMGGNGGNGNYNNNQGLLNSGVGAIGACSVLSTYPASGQTDVPRNTSLLVTFADDIKAESVCVNNSTGATCSAAAACQPGCNLANPVAIRLYQKDLGDACSASACPATNGNVTGLTVSLANDHKTLVIMPVNPLGSATGNTPYTIKFTGAAEKLDGSSLFSGCGSNFAAWDFTVNSNLDLTPPIVAPASQQPLPDNNADIVNSVTSAVAASGAVKVAAIPKIYAPAQVLSITPSGPTVTLNYHGALSEFKIAVSATAPDTAQLFDGSNNPLGVADFNAAGQATFPNFLSITAVNHPAGSLWDIQISPEQLADTLTVNSNVYTFATSSQNNNIAIAADPATIAANLEAKLSGEPDLNVSLSGATVGLTAKVAGLNGNNIAITTSNPAALNITPLTGGQNAQSADKVLGQPDRPMNTVIQLNFNKPINPLTVSGSADEVSNYIRVVNASASSSPSGAACTANADCASYKCDSHVCVGDYLGGNFTISNGYRTVEFTSDSECGLNACGEKIYCLPPNSHLAVKLQAADLKVCTSNQDCVSDGAYNVCASSGLSYKTCQNADSQNYPQADLSRLDGIVSATANSLDGNRNGAADGPISFYNDNYSTSSPINLNQKDKYEWSFFISDKLDLTPPQITAITPNSNESGVALTAPIQITFSKVMMNSSLTTGSVTVANGTATVRHKLINLYSLAPAPIGYWVLADNKDIPPLDNWPDITIASVFHSPLPEAGTYQVQVGSGVKDIYQNCFKPSSGPGCTATDAAPSCCFGTATSTLNGSGNCQ